MSPDPNAEPEFPEVDVPAEAASSKESVVRFLVGELAGKCQLSAEQIERITRQVIDRESLGTTGIGQGFALPHVLATDISVPCIVIGQLATPMDWQAIDGEPVRTVCLFLAPQSQDAGPRLQTLERLVRMLRNRVGG